MLVFSKRLVGVPGFKLPILEADLFLWDDKAASWKQTTSGTYSVPFDEIKTGTTTKLTTTRFRFGEDVTMYFGVIVDPGISDVIVSDSGGERHSAFIVLDKDGYTYWFAALPRQTGDNKVQSLDASGNVVTEDRYYNS